MRAAVPVRMHYQFCACSAVILRSAIGTYLGLLGMVGTVQKIRGAAAQRARTCSEMQRQVRTLSNIRACCCGR